MTSDEYYSPLDSICPSPEPKKNQINVDSKRKDHDVKGASGDLINSEKNTGTSFYSVISHLLLK